MMLRHITTRTAAIIAVAGAFSLAACGGGGTSSVAPSTVANGGSQSNTRSTTGFLTLTVPMKTSAQSAGTARMPTSTGRKPQFIDTTTTSSALVVSVKPQDPAEASQYGNLTVCYNLYTNGALAASAPPGFIVTALPATAPGTPGPNANVQVAIPAPPGTDGFQITQYAGQCGSTPFTIPTPPPTATGSGMLAQTPVVYAYLVPGAANNVNVQLSNCPQPVPPVSPNFTCPLGTGVGNTPIVVAAAVASIAIATLPITSPIRETSSFKLNNGQIGIPIPLEGLSASGAPIPGSPVNGAGVLPAAVSVALTETGSVGGPHTNLWLIDANTGKIAQQYVPGTPILIHNLNALTPADTTYAGAGAQTAGALPAPPTLGPPATPGSYDPWVLVLTYDGSPAAALTSATVTATLPATTTTVGSTATATVSPQSGIFTAVATAASGTGPTFANGTGYNDPASPGATGGVKGLLLAGTAAAPTVLMTDGTSLKVDGSAAATQTVPGAALSALTLAPFATTPFIYAVDNNQAPLGATSAAPVNSGIYGFQATAIATPGAPVPVAVQDGFGMYFAFNKPVGILYVAPFLYVADSSNSVYRVDIQSNAGTPVMTGLFQTGTNTFALPLNPPGSLSFAGAKYIGMVPDGSGNILLPDNTSGSARIAKLNPTTGAVTTFAAAPAGVNFAGLTFNGTQLYATSQQGQIYAVSATGVVSLGLTVAATDVDGPAGQVQLAPAATPTLAPVNYPLQGQALNPFNNVAPPTPIPLPYSLAPFNGTTIFAAPETLLNLGPSIANNYGVGIADSSAGATTAAAAVHADGGLVFLSPSAAATTYVTPGAALFADTGHLRQIVP